MSYTIQMMRTTDIFAEVMKPGVYSYSKARGWGWIQRLCFWTLEKIGCHHYADEVVDIERHFIDEQEFVHKLLEAREELFKFSREPKKIYLGPEDYDGILRRGQPSGPMSFEIELIRDRTIMKIPVEVIPWMRGVLVV